MLQNKQGIIDPDWCSNYKDYSHGIRCNRRMLPFSQFELAFDVSPYPIALPSIEGAASLDLGVLKFLFNPTDVIVKLKNKEFSAPINFVPSTHVYVSFVSGRFQMWIDDKMYVDEQSSDAWNDNHYSLSTGIELDGTDFILSWSHNVYFKNIEFKSLSWEKNIIDGYYILKTDNRQYLKQSNDSTSTSNKWYLQLLDTEKTLHQKDRYRYPKVTLINADSDQELKYETDDDLYMIYNAIKPNCVKILISDFDKQFKREKRYLQPDCTARYNDVWFNIKKWTPYIVLEEQAEDEREKIINDDKDERAGLLARRNKQIHVQEEKEVIKRIIFVMSIISGVAIFVFGIHRIFQNNPNNSADDNNDEGVYTSSH